MGIGFMVIQDGIAGLEEEFRNNVLIFKISGRLDAITTPIIEKKVFETIHKGHAQVLIHCGQLTYLSSAGMRMLLSMSKKLRGAGKMVLCCVNENVLDILKMAGFDQILEIATTEEAALQRF